MAMIAVLFTADAEPRLEPAALEELAKLGVTNIALVRDSSLAGLVLEGWAFDPDDAQRAVRVVGGAFEGVRTLQPLVQMGVSSASVLEGDRKE